MASKKPPPKKKPASKSKAVAKPKAKRGQPQYQPTKDARAMVRIAVAGGIKQSAIAMALDIAENTLRKHFKADIEHGKEMIDMSVVGALYKNAMAGSVKAQQFWLNTRRPKDWSIAYQMRHGLLGDDGGDYILEMNMGKTPGELIEAEESES